MLKFLTTDPSTLVNRLYYTFSIASFFSSVCRCHRPSEDFEHARIHMHMSVLTIATLSQPTAQSLIPKLLLRIWAGLNGMEGLAWHGPG